MKRKQTEDGILVCMTILETVDISNELRSELFTLLGALLADQKVLSKRAKQIRINSDKHLEEKYACR